MSFANKVVLVTGASSGIGAATANLFAKEGASVAMVGRNQKKLDAVASEITSIGNIPLVINADVAKDDDARRIIKETLAKFGKLDVLVNNAGAGKNGTILTGHFLEAYDYLMKVNVRAVINLTAIAVPHLIATKGNIVNISSTLGMTTSVYPALLPYCVSKAALDHFTRGVALELAPAGVRVNSVNPGPVATDFMENAGTTTDWDMFIPHTALRRTSNPEEIADLIFYLASYKAKGITGSLFVNDNGFSLKPRPQV